MMKQLLELQKQIDELRDLVCVGMPELPIAKEQSISNVSNPPTDAQLDSIFGTPAILGRGFIGTIDDNSSDTDVWIVWTTDASWFYVKGTKAV